MPERSRKPDLTLPESDKDPMAAELGRRGGIKGGRARAERLPPELRRAIAQRAAATRWARRDQPGGTTLHQPHLPGTPRAEAVGVLILAGRPLQVVRTDAGALLLGQLSLEAALGGAPLAPDVQPVAYHVPGEWQLKRGLPPQTFVSLLAEAAAAGDGRSAAAVELLATCAVAGLAPLIGETLPPPPAGRPEPGPANGSAAA
jgi:hypothetical protein